MQMKLCAADQKSLAASIGLHLLFIGFCYGIQPVPDGEAPNRGAAYAVEISLISAPPPTAKAIASGKKNVSDREKKAPVNALKRKTISKPKASLIDKRSLYHVGSRHTKKAGMILDLPGWKWDRSPNPKDSTEECGKIVFEIKIDAHGEIISIQTLEKTVTPVVEKIYEDALRELTFSKTSDIHPYYKVSTGKISFILVAK